MRIHTPAPYESISQRAFSVGLRAFGIAVTAFLILPLLVVIPLSFNAGSFLTFPLAGVSLRWYEALFSSDAWTRAFRNSVSIGLSTMTLATFLGTAAALGLKTLRPSYSHWLSFVILSPIIVPTVISAVGIY